MLRAPDSSGMTALGSRLGKGNSVLQIREQQLDILTEGATRQFELELMASLRGTQTDLIAELTDSVLLQMVRAGIERARGRGMTWRYSIALFVELMFVVAPNFDEYPQVNARLENPEVDPDVSIDSAVSALTGGEWREVQARSDARAWGIDLTELPEVWRRPRC